ncbi:MAG: hypothetical protein KBD76_14110 [Bacteriovorax sp.]|nr:hypothetical protein [Bacteriovorax sp.]
MMRTLPAVLVLLCSFVMNLQMANAKSADAFFKRFQVIRAENGKLIGIRDRTLPVKFSVIPYIKQIKSQLLKEQSLMTEANLANGSYESEVKNLLESEMDYSFSGNQDEYNQNLQGILESLRKLADLNVEGVFSHPVFKDVVEQFQGKMTEAILLLDPTIIANVNDSTYFYKKNVTYKAVTWGLDFARKRMSSLPMLNTASYIIVQVEKLITERRQFHQNMLMHYLENFKEEELGLTHEEVNLIWSSIYESRISWFSYWESKNARLNWDKYGVNNFYASFRQGTANLRNAGKLYSEVNERFNFAFQRVTFKNENVIVNLFDKENRFQNRPAVAYNFDRPTQVVRKRVLLTLAGLGLSFVPISSGIKDSIDSFIKSFYEHQKITEGALYGYFESFGNPSALEQMQAQYLNPFDSLSLE